MKKTFALAAMIAGFSGAAFAQDVPDAYSMRGDQAQQTGMTMSADRMPVDRMETSSVVSQSARWKTLYRWSENR